MCVFIKPASAQIVIAVNSNLQFGILEHQTTHNGQIRLGSNGAVTLTGSGMMYVSGASAGRVTITATPATGILEIKCRANARVDSATTAAFLSVSQLQIGVNAGVPFGSGGLCAGITAGSAVAGTADLSVTPTPVVFIGGRIVIGANALNGNGPNYSSTNAGGQAIRLRVLYQ